MSHHPLVSIIIPVYNGDRYLRISLDSIIAQTYPNTEILVMDDASTDKTADIIESYKDKVIYYRQSENRGQFGNANDGIKLSKGELIAVYHADDIYHPNIVEREVEFLRTHQNVGAVFCLDIFIDPKGNERGRVRIPREIKGIKTLSYPLILNMLLTYKNTFLIGPTSMVRASVYNTVGFYRGEEFGIASDLEMWLRISRKYQVAIIEDYLHRYRFGHENLSRRHYHLRTEIEGHFKIMDMHLAKGGLALAKPESLTSHEAHRMEDRLMVTINQYILGNLDKCRNVLNQIHLCKLLGSPNIQRGRLLILFLAMKFFALIPRISLISDIFYKHWHANKKIRS